jgi:hypothetical protein
MSWVDLTSDGGKISLPDRKRRVFGASIRTSKYREEIVEFQFSSHLAPDESFVLVGLRPSPHDISFSPLFS